MVTSRRYTRRELLQGHVLAGLARQAVEATRGAVARHLDPSAASDQQHGPVVAQQAPRSGAPAAHRRTMPLLRPPGAVREERFLKECTRCMDCATACPHGAVVEAPLRLREAAGTPVIVPEAAACRMCEDMPCIAACDPGVLDATLKPKMGVAKVMPHACMGSRGLGCSACVEHCPVEGAISLQAGTPVVHHATCTGCGVCAEVCPAPEAAILILPAAHRGDPRKEASA